MNTFKHILFDLGGVIFHLNYQLTYQAFQKLTGLDQEHFFHQLHQPAFFDQHERGEISDHIFLTSFKNLNSNISHQQIIDAWNAMLIGIPEENLLYLEKLSRTHTLYLLSNTNAIHWKKVEDILRQAHQLERFYACFKKVFLSYQIGMRKPELRIYEYCLKEISIPGQDLLFIDDNIHNIEAAKQCQIQSILYPKDNPMLGSTLPVLTSNLS